MAFLGYEVDDPRLVATRGQTGPVTAARQRRTWLIYLSMVALGAAPWLVGAGAAWQAAGLGLWFPGGGFLALGGWWTLGCGLAALVFVISLVAWFWAGAIVAPAGVWFGSAVVAALLAGEASWPGAPWGAAATVVAVGSLFTVRNRRAVARGRARASRREAFLPQSLAEVAASSRARPDAAMRELSPDQLAGLRYLLDRALQPVDRFDGFTIIDQFQPAALRYQINHMGFALAIAQGAYLPNFRGYLGLAQRNMIEKYLERKVWDYWVLESCWGHLNFTDWDPAARDNIMLTGWFGAHVGQYMLATGDRRYLEPGSLSFRLNAKTVYRHDYRSIVASVHENYLGAEFGHYACEPNWIYPICNHYGMLALVTQDALLGTDHVGRHLPNWFDKLDTEFTDASGSIIGLRSQLTGLPVPFPVTETGYSYFEHAFAPARARRLWAIARRELEPLIVDEADGPRLKIAGEGLDAGNYRPGHTGAYGSILAAAREFGDVRVAEAARRALEAECAPRRADGVLAYLKGSNISNATAIMGLLMDVGDFGRSFSKGVDARTLAGPMVESLDYPAVLLSRAWSDGAMLEAVFHPGAGPGRFAVPLSQLVPGRRYAVEGAIEEEVVGDAAGLSQITLDLAGRVLVRLSPIE